MRLDDSILREIDRLKQKVCCQGGFSACDADIQDPDRIRFYLGACVNQCLGDCRDCHHRVEFSGDVAFCRCAVRKYIAKQFGKCDLGV